MVRWSRGTPKARVLPEPVLALPQTSRPARASATVIDWMAKVVVIPWAARALTRAGSTPREAKVGASPASPRAGVQRLVGGIEDAIRRIDNGCHGV